MKKQILFVAFFLFIPYIFILGQQSTFGIAWPGNPSNTFGYSSDNNIINPSSYYSPVPGSTTLPSPAWSGCNGVYNVSGTNVTNGSQMPDNNAVQGATNWIGWDTRQFKPYTNSRVNFRIFTPPGYDQNDLSKQYPVILFLHGLGEGGEWGIGPCDVRRHNNIYQMLHGGKAHNDIAQNDPYKAIIIFPQNERGIWTGGDYDQLISVMQSLTFLINGGSTTDNVKFNIDPNRVYLEGLSSGGVGEWQVLNDYINTFAGSIILSAAGPTDAGSTSKLKYTGIWEWQGALDMNTNTNQTVADVYKSRNTYTALTDPTIASFKRYNQTDITSGGPINGTATNHYIGNKRYLEESNEGHGVFTDCYSHPDYWKWLFSQNILNIVPFSDTSICTGSSIKIGIQPGFAEYDWQYSLDGSSYSSTLPLSLANNTNDLIVTELGFYRVRLRRATLGWSYYSQPIQIIRKASTPAQVIAQNNSSILPSLAGNNLTLSAPTGFTNYIWNTGSTNISIDASAAGNYYVSVKSSTLCQGINSDPLTVLTGQLPLSTIASPSNLQTFTINATSLNLSWLDNSNNESGFEIYRSSNNGVTYTYVGLTSANANNFIDNILTPNTSYTYKIRAMKKAVGASDYSNSSLSSTTVDNVAPTKPTNLTSSNLTSTSVNLSWTASTDNVGVVGYDIYANGINIGSSSSTTFNATGLTNGTSYVFKVIAKDAIPNYSLPSDDLQIFTYLNSLVSGLNYEYYENTYSDLNSPLFGNDVPKKTGYINNFSLSPRLKDSNFGFNFFGYITIATSGIYTFYTESDDGSNLFVNNTQVVANDFNQALVGSEKSGTISLNAGTYPIQVTFRQGGGGFGLNVRWSGPSISKILIPDNVLFRNGLPAGLYYTNIASPLNVTPSWGDSPDGTGNQPNFSNSSQIFYINKNNASLGGNLTVGSNSKIVIMNNASFILDKTFNGIIDIQGNGQLTIKNSTATTFGSVSTASTVIFDAITTVSSNTSLGNVILKSGTTTINGSNLNVLGDLTFQGGNFGSAGSSSLSVNGNINYSASTTIPVNLNLSGINQTITGNGNLNLVGLNLAQGSIVSLSSNNSTNLVSTGDLVLQNASYLNLNSNSLTINGDAGLDPGLENGLLGINNGSIIINTNTNKNSNLYFNPSLNNISNLTINNSGGGSVLINNILNLYNTLTLQNGIFNTTNGNLILKSNAISTARIAKVQSGASLIGNITQERYITASSYGKGWFFTSTPIKNQTVSNWVNEASITGPWQNAGAFPTIHEYKENVIANRALNDPRNYENFGWFGLTNLTDPIKQGQGYKIYLYNEFFTSRNSTLQNTGAPVIGDGVDGTNAGGAEAFIFNLTYSPLTGYNGGGWNFISNPFPSDIDWAGPGWSRSATVDNAVYIWNSQSNNGKGSYVSYVKVGNNVISQIPNAIAKIASGQSFFVKANGVNPTLSATEDVKTATTTSFLRKETPENLLRITLLNQKKESSSSVIYFTKHATSNFDSEYDAHLISSGNINLGSLSKDKKELSINGLSSMKDSIPLIINHNAKGSYSLNFSSLETFKTDTKIYLSDKFNKSITLLNSNNDYSFNITQDTNTFIKRFALIFEHNSSLVSDDLNSVETSKVFSIKSMYPNPFNEEAKFKYNIPQDGIIEINILNSRGQLVDKITNPSKSGENIFVWNPHQRNITLTSGLYFYTIQYNQKTLSGKMIYINQ